MESRSEVRLLLDTNIPLEIILDQDEADEARDLLIRGDEHLLHISDYGLHSVELLLVRRQQPDIFREFVQDVIIGGVIAVSSLSAEDMEAVHGASEIFNLHFDDANHYALTHEH